jgi:hypothetical protein
MTGQIDPTKLHAGHRWIEQMATDIASTLSLKIEIQGWADATVWPGTAPGVIYSLQARQALVFDVRGERYSIEFDRDVVDDCAEEDFDKKPQGIALEILNRRLREIQSEGM